MAHDCSENCTTLLHPTNHLAHTSPKYIHPSYHPCGLFPCIHISDGRFSTPHSTVLWYHLLCMDFFRSFSIALSQPCLDIITGKIHHILLLSKAYFICFPDFSSVYLWPPTFHRTRE